MENQTTQEQKIEIQVFIKPDFVDSLKLLFGRSFKTTVTCLIPQSLPIERFNSYAKTETVGTTQYFTKQDKPNYGWSPKQ